MAENGNGVLASNVTIVMLQFSFSNRNVVPCLFVKWLEKETPQELEERKKRAGTGKMFIEPTLDVSLLEFLKDLEGAGYELVDSFYKERIDYSRGNGTFHCVRFTFARHEFAVVTDKFAHKRAFAFAELEKFCREASWRVRAFLCPFYRDGKEILGHNTVSINLVARNPLVEPDGKPRLVWQKDERGQRLGTEKIPLRPKFQLRIIGGVARVVSVGKSEAES